MLRDETNHINKILTRIILYQAEESFNISFLLKYDCQPISG